MKNMTPKKVLELPMPDNDAGATTIRGYFVGLLRALLERGDGFSGKRPFGNSGWQFDLYEPLITAGLIDGAFDSDGCIESCDCEAGDRIIVQSVMAML